MATLTEGRLAVWDAIDNWSDLQDVFRQKYRGDAEGSPLERPTGSEKPSSPNELPAIEIAPATIEFNWITNELASNEYALAVTIWTRDWTWTQSEQLQEEVIKAAFRSHPGDDTVPYIVRATGKYPRILSSRFQRIRLGPDDTTPKALAHTFGIAVRVNLQPLVN